MNTFVKPRNKWGWARLAGFGALVAVAAWVMIANALRSMGEIPWMAWSGYQSFSFIKGIEIAIILLLVVLVAGWQEEQDAKAEVEQANHREAEHTAAAHRMATIRHIQEAVTRTLAGAALDAQNLPEVERTRLGETIREALARLDGKGRGEVLQFLFEKGIFNGDAPVFNTQDADFGGAELHKPHLNQIALRGANLENARFDGAHMANSRLSGTNFSRALLRHADLTGADLAGSNLTKAHLEGANLESANLAGACFKGTFLMNANLRHCDFGVSSAADAEEPSSSQHLLLLEHAILIDTLLPDGRKVTNERGREYQHKKELAYLVDRL